MAFLLVATHKVDLDFHADIKGSRVNTGVLSITLNGMNVNLEQLAVSNGTTPVDTPTSSNSTNSIAGGSGEGTPTISPVAPKAVRGRTNSTPNRPPPKQSRPARPQPPAGRPQPPRTTRTESQPVIPASNPAASAASSAASAISQPSSPANGESFNFLSFKVQLAAFSSFFSTYWV